MSAAAMLEEALAQLSARVDADPTLRALVRVVAALAQPPSPRPAPVVRLGIAAVEARVGVERSTLWRWYRDGKFPRPEYLGGVHRVWTVEAIEKWEREQAGQPRRAPRGIAARLARREG